MVLAMQEKKQNGTPLSRWPTVNHIIYAFSDMFMHKFTFIMVFCLPVGMYTNTLIPTIKNGMMHQNKKHKMCLVTLKYLQLNVK